MSNEDKILLTVDEVVEAFGGTSRFARAFGWKPSRVSNYRSWGRFPAHIHMKVYMATRQRGLELHPSLIGLEEHQLV